jgi:hypothetical protein
MKPGLARYVFRFRLHNIGLPLGLRGLVAKNWNGTSRAGLQPWEPLLYALVALEKLLIALASSSWTSKTV